MVSTVTPLMYRFNSSTKPMVLHSISIQNKFGKKYPMASFSDVETGEIIIRDIYMTCVTPVRINRSGKVIDLRAESIYKH